MITTFLVIVSILLAVFFMVRIRKPDTVLERAANCNLLWGTEHTRLIESVYDHPTWYDPQRIGFRMYELIAEHEQRLLKGLGKDATKEDMHVIADMLEYLVFFWLGKDATRFTHRLDLQPKTVDLEEIAKYVGKNHIVALARRLNTGWVPPNITIKIPKDLSLSVTKPGKLLISNQYFSIQIIYHYSLRDLSSMRIGPVSSIMGMPINPFFLEKERKPERRFKLSELRVAFCEIFFTAKFNERILLLKPHKRRMFYKYMQWVEQLSIFFLDFFDWERNRKVALESQDQRIYETLKGIETRMEFLEKKIKN